MAIHPVCARAAESSRARNTSRGCIKKLCRIPVWSSGPREKIVIPGFADLHSFSVAYEGLLKENLGNWFPSYLRIGNWRMTMGHLRAGQAAADRWLEQVGRPRGSCAPSTSRVSRP